jgi:EAL domain-containing protein (putative c-di-GMP-specific phosphodiesterase class I)
LAAYDLIKEHPINHPQHAVLRSTEFLTQSLDTSLIYTLPDQVVLDLTQFQRVLDAMSENDQFANRIIVAIREEAAAKLSLEHWQIAGQMQTHGARFALSDIGTGDSDLSLLGNELFDFLSISAELTELAFTSEKNTVVLKNLLNLAQTLGKPSIVCTAPEHTNELKTLGADYISPS